MKGTLFSADFVKDASANLRLLEINTDTAFLNTELNSLDLTDFINVLSTNSITELVLVYKPTIHHGVIAKIESIINTNASFITTITKQEEDRNAIYPEAVTDADNKFILRLAYDEAALLDSSYAKNRLNLMNLFTDASGDGTNTYTVEYYHSSSNGVYNTITPAFNPAGLPDATIKDVDETFNPIDFFKIGSEVEGETDQARWDAFIAANKADDKVIEKFSYHSSATVNNKLTSVRVFGIVYGSTLSWLPILSYKIPAILDHPTTALPEVDNAAYSSKLNDEHFYEFATNFTKETNRGILGTQKLELADGTFSRFDNTPVGTLVKSYFISGSPTLESDEAISAWGISGSTFPVGSHLTSSNVTYVDTVNLKYGAVIELDVNGDTLYVGPGKDFLVYNSASNVMSYKTAINIDPDTDYFTNKEGALVDIDAVNFFVSSDTDLTLVELDVEDTDTVIISGSTAINSIVAHNAPCFVEGTLITLADGTKKAIEEIKVGDSVLTFNLISKEIEKQEVEATTSKRVHSTVQYGFEDGTVIEATNDHPLYCSNLGWVSNDVDYTKEKYNMNSSQIAIGCEILKADGSSNKLLSIKNLEESKVVYNLRQVAQNHNFFVYDLLASNREDFVVTCFVEGTKISLSNDDEKNIEDIVVGDKVLSYKDGKLVEAEVIGVDHRHTVESHANACKELGNEVGAYTINNSGLLFTPEHPFLTPEGYKSLVPDVNQEPYKSEQPALILTDKDTVKNIDNLDGWESISNITHFVLPKDTKVYNITVKDTHNYIANKYVVHNK